jgi:hypothetical protein
MRLFSFYPQVSDVGEMHSLVPATVFLSSLSATAEQVMSDSLPTVRPVSLRTAVSGLSDLLSELCV